MKVLYLSMQGRIRKWTRAPQGWKAALQHFSIYFEDRIPV